MALADLGAGCAKLLDGDELPAALLTAGKIPRRGLTETGYRHEGRAQALIVHDDELRRLRRIEVYRRELKAALIELIHRLHRDEKVLLVRGELALSHIRYLAVHILRAA